MSVSQNPMLQGDSTYLVRPALHVSRSQNAEPRARVPAKSRAKSSRAPDEIWGQYNNYRANGIAVSAIVHLVFLGLLVSGVFVSHQIVEKVTSRPTVTLIAPPPESYALPTSRKVVSGGGGGGDHDPLPAPKAALPKPAPQQITPPAIILRNEKPRLAAEPTVVAPPKVAVASTHMPSLGVPERAVMPSAPPSNGVGSGGGIGSGSGGGVGAGHGPGVGIGSGGGIGGGVYKVGAGISAPQAIDSPDPQYTEEARRTKTQGTCILWLIVDSTGHPQDVRVVRGLGHGLDEKATEAVRQWRFQPAMKDGKPVNVEISVEVEFHLY
jgi:protein TonB